MSMASKIEQILAEAQKTACQVTNEIKSITEISILIRNINFDMVQAAYKLVWIENCPEMIAFDKGLQDAIQESPPTERQYQVARKITEAFTLVRLPSDQKGGELTDDGFVTGDLNKPQPSLKVGKDFSIERFNKGRRYEQQVEIVITGNGDLLIVAAGSDTRSLIASEILSHGREILEAIQPPKLESLLSLAQEAKDFQWSNLTQ